MTVKCPKRDGSGFEWILLDATLSGHDADAWSRGWTVDLAIELEYVARRGVIGRFDSEEEADATSKEYHEHNIVEYGPSSAEFDFPFPNWAEIEAGVMCWRASKEYRELVQQLEFLVAENWNLPFQLWCEHGMLENLSGELEDPEAAYWHEMIRARDIPEAEGKVTALIERFSTITTEIAETEAAIKTWFDTHTFTPLATPTLSVNA